jgi:hypothetical protein
MRVLSVNVIPLDIALAGEPQAEAQVESSEVPENCLNSALGHVGCMIPQHA